MKLSAADPILVELAAGRRYRIDPPTRRQVRECLRLDPQEGAAETESERDRRTAAQLACLLHDAHLNVARSIEVDADGAPVAQAAPLDPGDLTRTEEQELLFAIYTRHLGMDAEAVVAMSRTLKKNLAAVATWLAASNDTTPTPSLSPCSSAAP